ncbi:hypothetical protein HDU91_007358, partial [Kappamyces sp. JEL0680]
ILVPLEVATQTFQEPTCYSLSCREGYRCYSYICPRSQRHAPSEIATQTEPVGDISVCSKCSAKERLFDATEVSDKDTETAFDEEEGGEQDRVALLEAENVRLLQELQAMKLMVVTSRSQTQQMQILKEAAEARFEQLARVCHRKLVRAMVDQ